MHWHIANGEEQAETMAPPTNCPASLPNACPPSFMHIFRSRIRMPLTDMPNNIFALRSSQVIKIWQSFSKPNLLTPVAKRCYGAKWARSTSCRGVLGLQAYSFYFSPAMPKHHAKEAVADQSLGLPFNVPVQSELAKSCTASKGQGSVSPMASLLLSMI